MFRLFFLLVSLFLFCSNASAQSSLVQGNLLEKSAVLEDIDLLERALTEIHPGVYRYMTPEDLKKEIELFKNELPAQISEGELMKRMAQLLTHIKCGHTYVNPWNMDSDLRQRLFGGEIFLPVGFTIVEGRFYVTENASSENSLQRGAEIHRINGHPTPLIYEQLKTIARSDGNNTTPYDNYLSLKDYQEYLWNAFDLYFPLFFPLTSGEFEIEFQNYQSDQVQKVTVKALSKAERAEKMIAKYGDEVMASKRWKLQIINNDLAVIKLGTFAIWNWKNFNYKTWLKDAFKEINSKGIKHLVIDIRGNGGGMGEPRDELMTYLTNKKLDCEEDGKVLIRTTKVDESLHPYCDTYAKPLLSGLPKSKFAPFDQNWFELKEKGDCVTIKPKKDRFTGTVYVFGNGSNVSATYQQLDKLKRNGLATLIGDTSGGNLQGVNGGQYIFFRLPNSKMEVDIPLKFFAPKNPQPDSGVVPDVKVTVTQQSIAEGKDAYLDYVLSLLK